MYDTKKTVLDDLRSFTEKRYAADEIGYQEYEYLMTLYSDRPVEEIINELEEIAEREGFADEWLTEEELFEEVWETVHDSRQEEDQVYENFFHRPQKQPKVYSRRTRKSYSRR